MRPGRFLSLNCPDRNLLFNLLICPTSIFLPADHKAESGLERNCDFIFNLLTINICPFILKADGFSHFAESIFLTDVKFWKIVLLLLEKLYSPFYILWNLVAKLFVWKQDFLCTISGNVHQVIKGWEQGVLGMCVGEKRKVSRYPITVCFLFSSFLFFW